MIITILQEAITLLKSIGCPEPIMDALWLWGLMVSDEDIKLKNWSAWAEGQLVDGEIIVEQTRLEQGLTNK